MRIAMVSLIRTKSGRWAARKVIPADVRDAYGKREEKKTWPASLSAGQAKDELAAWLGPIEGRIALLRAAVASQPVCFTKRQCHALAGEWYRAKVDADEAAFTDSAGFWDWDADLAAILPDAEHSDEVAPLRPIAPIVQARDQLLLEKGLQLGVLRVEVEKLPRYATEI